MDKQRVARELVKTARELMSAKPKIGPGVKLEGKKGVFTVSSGPSELRPSPHGYDRMTNAGYTHFVVLKSPRGKEMKCYLRDGGRDGRLYWYKNHRSLVPFKFENVEAGDIGISTAEKKAIAFGKNKGKVTAKMLRFVQMMDPDIRNAFADGKWTYDARKHRMTSSDGRYGMQWRVRRYPDKPVSAINDQDPEGHIEILTPRDRWSSERAAGGGLQKRLDAAKRMILAGGRGTELGIREIGWLADDADKAYKRMRKLQNEAGYDDEAHEQLKIDLLAEL